MNDINQTVMVGRLTQAELDIVIESITRVATLLNVSIEIKKPEPGYRQVILSGNFWDVTTITNLMQDCKVLHD